VVVLTRNGMPLLERTLAAVLAQDCEWRFDVLVIDSESSDGSWELAGSLPVERLRVRVDDFNHGDTRNLAARQVRGTHAVFLVQDAVPADRMWLRQLVAAAELSEVVGSYSRQLPQPDAPAAVTLHQRAALPQADALRVQRLAPGQSWATLSPAEQFALATFRNNSSCIRRSVLLERPFQRLSYGEDLEWGQRAVRDGLALVYEPASTVYHSHDRSSWYELKRAYADHVLVGELFGYRVYPSARALAASWTHELAAVRAAVWNEPLPLAARLHAALRTALAVSARHAGSWLGARTANRAMAVPIDRILRRGV